MILLYEILKKDYQKGNCKTALFKLNILFKEAQMFCKFFVNDRSIKLHFSVGKIVRFFPHSLHSNKINYQNGCFTNRTCTFHSQKQMKLLKQSCFCLECYFIEKLHIWMQTGCICCTYFFGSYVFVEVKQIINHLFKKMNARTLNSKSDTGPTQLGQSRPWPTSGKMILILWLWHSSPFV